MKTYTVKVHVPEQDLDVEVLAYDVTNARRLIREQFDGLHVMIVWVQPS
jgi:hypothetical protein